MKANNKIKILAILIGAILFSCEEKLDISPISNVSADGFFKTESDIEQAVVACYDNLQEEGQYGFDYMFLMEIRSDNAFVESPTNSGGDQGNIDLFQVSSGNFRINDAWNSCYRGIQRFNTVLNRIDDIDMDASLKNTRIGEVKFLRALTYFNLVRLWGDVPLVVEETTDPFEAFSIGRTSVNEVYTQIISDLSEAISILPNTNQSGRATKGAAQALFGKVHLTMGNWSDAITILDAVTGYSLQANFADNFGIANENGTESIFEVQFQGGSGSIMDNSLTNNTGEGSPYPNQVAPVGSANELLKWDRISTWREYSR